VVCSSASQLVASVSLLDVTTAERRVKHNVEKTVGHRGGQKACMESVLMLWMNFTKSDAAVRSNSATFGSISLLAIELPRCVAQV
jgi:hypothetical protein